eukprot:TRINITY_DN12679_c0_g1_i5.p1 TRINITY_DN12679_c0_g1~~TRINITY_DN12679_c0_g1_i5.p1  ORF type:complete len:127 (+),score=6.59 TRINITY_DN12679_c0_g1_i5:48-383(+)
MRQSRLSRLSRMEFNISTEESERMVHSKRSGEASETSSISPPSRKPSASFSNPLDFPRPPKLQSTASMSGVELGTIRDSPTSPPELVTEVGQIGRAVQQECRDRSRMPSSA